MASVPLMSDQDVELGALPSYEEALQGKNGASKATETSTNNSRTPGKQQKKIGGLFGNHFDDVADSSAVAFAQVSIRLAFLRKVLGILSFQFMVTVVFSTVRLYMTPGVKGFVQEQ
uniref:Uncharacterized protein n=1 Tax=Ditylenchus dipsaci TaxID=166011 RepID=A0A915DNY0_9BILA